MLKIDEIRIDHRSGWCLTDRATPILSFALKSDVPDTELSYATVRIGKWEKKFYEQTGIVLAGLPLIPFTAYRVEITAYDNHGQTASGSAGFSTGRMGTAWKAKWITDKTYRFAKRTSPKPMTFRKNFATDKPVKKAYITTTAIGIYELQLNGTKIGNQYFAPGFTSYKNRLQYQYHDITGLIAKQNTVTAVVGGGWAVGRFTYSSKSKITADRQAFLFELFIEYADGSIETIVTDNSWEVTENGNYRFGDFYDGEYYDSTVELEKQLWKKVAVTKFKTNLVIQIDKGVIAHEQLFPVSVFEAANGKEIIYDFGQNFAGVVHLKIHGKRGQKITVRHAELLHNGDLCLKSLRTAKATATYICKDGKQEYSPRLTYMGFRYIAVSGISERDIEVSSYALYSDFEQIGSFHCSNERLNKLQSNIEWSGKSNFIEVPTDCPQRDERMGWTGDISLFARTACFNFDLGGFLEKWLQDVSAEQGRGGGIPLVVPKQGISAPTVATACWGDCCILVPWAEYLARGDQELLRRQYPTIKKFLKAVKFWSGLFSIGTSRRRIWKWLFQFGDWCAPYGGVRDWMKKGKWVATAYYANSCAIAAEIAGVLNLPKDKEHYLKLNREIVDAYRKIFTDKKGKLKKEFQTGYVLPLHFHMAEGQEKANMAANLNRLMIENGYRLNMGFTGTPYLLFALADNGYLETAYQVLLQEYCPSWFYCVKKGATTFWEQWDVILPDGSIKNVDGRDIPSFNHYAYGAVGDFLYRRVAGLEAIEGGYKTFRVQPLVGGNLTFAECKTKSPYGEIAVKWQRKKDQFTLDITVPVSCSCEAVLPSGKTQILKNGKHTLIEKLEGGNDESLISIP